MFKDSTKHGISVLHTTEHAASATLPLHTRGGYYRSRGGIKLLASATGGGRGMKEQPTGGQKGMELSRPPSPYTIVLAAATEVLTPGTRKRVTWPYISNYIYSI